MELPMPRLLYAQHTPGRIAKSNTAATVLRSSHFVLRIGYRPQRRSYSAADDFEFLFLVVLFVIIVPSFVSNSQILLLFVTMVVSAYLGFPAQFSFVASVSHRVRSGLFTTRKTFLSFRTRTTSSVVNFMGT